MGLTSLSSSRATDRSTKNRSQSTLEGSSLFGATSYSGIPDITNVFGWLELINILLSKSY